MLTCQSCFRKHLQNFLRYSIQSRAYHESASSSALRPKKYASPSEKLGFAAGRDAWIQSRGKTPAHKLKARKVPKEAAIKKHLVFLKDPLKLANDILNTLRHGRFEEAQEVVRTASKEVLCVVSWNHLIDFQMSEGNVNGAVKTYNEMKKRSQLPDSRTFTILFRGFAAHSKYPHALEKSLSIYHSMWLPTSPVKPNTIHTNAMLKVCARAGDLDALFTVAAKLPLQGFKAADNLTFTIILNAIREYAIRDTHGRLTEAEMKEDITKAVINGRRMWDDIIARWRRADIFIDEELACAMGRLLLIGQDPKDWDDIFSLVQQTMNIPRPFERLGTPQRDRHEPSRQTQTDKPQSSTEVVEASKPWLEEEVNPDEEFQMVTPPPANSARNTGTGGYVRPGNNALSLILEAMLKSTMKRYAKHYWEVFTVTHKVKPDQNNYTQLLRVLRGLRASSEALEVLMKMDKRMLERKMYRIALSACDRDKLNPHAFANAGKILDLMQQHLEEADCPSLHSYLCVAMCRVPEHSKPSTVQATEHQFALGRQILRALHRLQPSVINIKSYLNYGGHKLQAPNTIKSQTLLDAAPDQRYVVSAIQLFSRMVSAYDKLTREGMVVREEIPRLLEEKSILNAYINRLNIKLRSRHEVEEEKGKSRQENRAAKIRSRSIWIAKSAEATIAREKRETKRQAVDRSEVREIIEEVEKEDWKKSVDDLSSIEAKAKRIAEERRRREIVSLDG